MNIVDRILLAHRKIRSDVKQLSFPYARYEKKNNFIFIHIPKVAGTSILRAIGKQRGGRNHLPWYVYKTANPVFFENAFKFSLVRNPWDRTLSAYRYLCRGGNRSSDISLSQKIRRYKDFSDFVRNGLGAGLYRNHLLFLPQSEFVVTGEGEIAVDFIGRYENLHGDCRFIFEKIGINPDQLEKKNSSGTIENYRRFYKMSDDVEIIDSLYKQDIRVFGYSF